MPRRSNEFQHLVAMLTALSSDGAAVHESVELIEIASTETREVDVVAIGEVAGHQTVVCIECRDWKRPQTVEWVEQACTKFDDLGANVRVLVSSSGFTKPALTGVPVSTLHDWAAKRERGIPAPGPHHIRLSNRHRRWARNDVDQWIDSARI